jgi:hypothetical protein
MPERVTYLEQTTNSSGIVNMTYAGYGTVSLNYTGKTEVLAYEHVTVPYGSFDAFKVRQTVRIYNGSTVDSTVTDTVWLTKDIGQVKDEVVVSGGPTTTSVLVSAANLPDGADDALENAAPNHGDGNGDGSLDSGQDNVVSLPSSVTGSYLTVSTLQGSGAPISYASSVTEGSLGDDPNYDFPYGLMTFQINGLTPGATETVRLYFHGVADLSGYDYRKFNPNTATWYTLPDVVFGSALIGGQAVAYADLPLTDGGSGDADGAVNASIIDPGGPALPVCTLAGDFDGDCDVDGEDLIFYAQQLSAGTNEITLEEFAANFGQ